MKMHFFKGEHRR